LKGFCGWFGIAADACRLHCQGTELADQPLAQVLSCLLLVKSKIGANLNQMIFLQLQQRQGEPLQLTAAFTCPIALCVCGVHCH